MHQLVEYRVKLQKNFHLEIKIKILHLLGKVHKKILKKKLMLKEIIMIT